MCGDDDASTTSRRGGRALDDECDGDDDEEEVDDSSHVVVVVIGRIDRDWRFFVDHATPPPSTLGMTYNIAKAATNQTKQE
jgi:hypothetical protein